MLRPIFLRLARSRRAARALLGLDLPALGPGAHYFDATTLALVAAARRRIPPDARVLDVGTGSAAVLASWLARRGCRVIATELDPRIADEADASLRHQGLAVPVRRGSLFAGVAGELDFVLFNPPYVPSGAGADCGRTEAYRAQWDGGPEGTSTIAAFLDAAPLLAGAPTFLLGVNRRHVPRAKVEALFAARPALRLEEVARAAPLPGLVYVFSTRKSPIASTSSPDE